MQSRPLQELSDLELAAEFKKRKNNFLYSCVFVGFIFGIAVYSTIRNGFGILSFLPFIFAPIFAPAGKSYKEIKAEMASRAGKL